MLMSTERDVQRMNFEIIGKTASNYLIYKEIKADTGSVCMMKTCVSLKMCPFHFAFKTELMDVTFSLRNGVMADLPVSEGKYCLL